MANKPNNINTNWQAGIYVDGTLTDNAQMPNDVTVEVTLRLQTPPVLSQIAFSADNAQQVSEQLQQQTGATIPPPAVSHCNNHFTLLRPEPFKVWVLGEQAITVETTPHAYHLDLTHSHVFLQIYGRQATTLLNKYLAVDLRPDAFPINAVKTTVFHHCRVILHRQADSNDGHPCFCLILPRGFALSLTQLLHLATQQFCHRLANATP